MLVGIASDGDDVDLRIGQELLEVLVSGDLAACLALSSAESKGRGSQIAATWAQLLELMVAIWAVATHPYPSTATLSFFTRVLSY